MMLFSVRGGVKLSYRKELSSESPIVRMPTPKTVYVPLQQHVGSPAEPTVKVGQWVGKGQLIGRAGRGISANVHASTSGTVIAIEDRTAPHPSGLTQPTVVIETDGDDRWADLAQPITADFPLPATPKEMNDRVAAAGIVGLGVAAFPSAVKLDMRYKIIDANTTEQVAQGYIEEKMETGKKSTSIFGVSTGASGQLTLDSLVQHLVQRAQLHFAEFAARPGVGQVLQDAAAMLLEDRSLWAALLAPGCVFRTWAR